MSEPERCPVPTCGVFHADGPRACVSAFDEVRDRAIDERVAHVAAREQQLRVVAVALYDDTTKVTYSKPAPARHHDIINALFAASGVPVRDMEQGFLLSDGRFVMRKAALLVARRAGQVLRESAPEHGLFSEDVW